MSKCWAAFFLLYWTSLGLSAKARRQPSSCKASCRVSTGSCRQPSSTGRSSHLTRSWQSRPLSRECGAGRGPAPRPRLRGWLELGKQLRVTQVSSTGKPFRTDREAVKAKEWRPEGESSWIFRFRFQSVCKYQLGPDPRWQEMPLYDKDPPFCFP